MNAQEAYDAMKENDNYIYMSKWEAAVRLGIFFGMFGYLLYLIIQ